MSAYNKPRYNREGKPICEICGKAYTKLLAHVAQKHDMTAAEYKEAYGYDPKKGIISQELRDQIKDKIYADYPARVEQLKKAGKKTQFKKGNKAAKKKPENKPKLSIQQMISRLSESGVKKSLG